MMRLLLTCIALISIAFAGCEAHADTPSGWNYDLTSRCSKTTDSSAPNYFEDPTGCSGTKDWTLVVQAESNMGQSCVGPNNQSYLINGWGSPVTLGWTPHTSDLGPNWTANLKVDTSNGTSCDNQYTFFGFFDHSGYGGGPLPSLTNLQSSHEIAYQQFALPSGETRLTIGAQVFWGGKAHLLEILPAKIGYNTNPGFPAGVIQKTVTDLFEYVILDDSWGVKVVPDGSTQFVYVNWASIYARLIELGMFTSPGSEPTETQAVYLAVETHNKGIANLYQTNFRVSSM